MVQKDCFVSTRCHGQWEQQSMYSSFGNAGASVLSCPTNGEESGKIIDKIVRVSHLVGLTTACSFHVPFCFWQNQ